MQKGNKIIVRTSIFTVTEVNLQGLHAALEIWKQVRLAFLKE